MRFEVKFYSEIKNYWLISRIVILQPKLCKMVFHDYVSKKKCGGIIFTAYNLFQDTENWFLQ